MSDEIQLRRSDLEYAVLDIYNDLNVPATGRLAIPTLEMEWDKTGLRKADLLNAVEYLLEKNYLQPFKVDDNAVYLQLTDEGKRHAGTEYSISAIRDRFHASKMLSRSQERRREQVPQPLPEAERRHETP